MSGLRIYGIARTRAFRALWVAMELGIDYEHIPLEIGVGRRPHRGIPGGQSERPAAGDRRRRLRPVGVARDHALSRQEAFARRPLSGDAEAEAKTWLWTPVGAQRGRSRSQHLVAARHPPAARGSRSGEARRGAQGDRAAVQGARRGARRAAVSRRRRFHRRRSQRRRGDQPGDRDGPVGDAASRRLAQALPRTAGRAGGAPPAASVGRRVAARNFHPL